MLMAVLASAAAIPPRRTRPVHTEEPRREPVEPKPQREPPKEITEEGQRRIQAAAERRANRNAKRANKGNGDE
jgi:hypothetical protein